MPSPGLSSTPLSFPEYDRAGALSWYFPSSRPSTQNGPSFNWEAESVDYFGVSVDMLKTSFPHWLVVAVLGVPMAIWHVRKSIREARRQAGKG